MTHHQVCKGVHEVEDLHSQSSGLLEKRAVAHQVIERCLELREGLAQERSRNGGAREDHLVGIQDQSNDLDPEDLLNPHILVFLLIQAYHMAVLPV